MGLVSSSKTPKTLAFLYIHYICFYCAMQINGHTLVKLLSNKSVCQRSHISAKKKAGDVFIFSRLQHKAEPWAIILLYSLCLRLIINDRFPRSPRSPTPTLLSVLNTSARTLPTSLPAVANPCIGLLSWRRRTRRPPPPLLEGKKRPGWVLRISPRRAAVRCSQVGERYRNRIIVSVRLSNVSQQNARD